MTMDDSRARQHAHGTLGLVFVLMTLGFAARHSEASSPVATTTTITSSVNPSSVNQSVTFTANVSAASGQATGNVFFKKGNATLGKAALAGGVATFTISTLHKGSVLITASYLGTKTYAGSSATLSQTVDASGYLSYSLAATPLIPSVIGAGGSSSSTITVTPNNGYSGAVSLSCGTITGGTPAPVCSFNPSSVSVSGTSAASSILTVTTATSAPLGTYGIPVTGIDGNSAAPNNGAQALSLTTVSSSTVGYVITVSALSPSNVTAGSASTASITVTSVNGYSGSVSLSCNTITGGALLPSCSFKPGTVTVSPSVAGSSTLTVSTQKSLAAATFSVPVTGADANNHAPVIGTPPLSLLASSLIQHIIIIFQENRTPDNMFQDPVLISRGADIVSSGINSLGQTIPLAPIDLGTAGSSPQFYDLAHSHISFLDMYDGGKMDGANLIGASCNTTKNCPPNPQFMYVIPADVAPYFAMAEQYTFGDRMFQSNQGQSYPAHQFILSGTSAPTATSPLFAAETPTNEAAGCIAPAGTVITMIDAEGSETAYPREYPCWEHPTVSDLLDAQDITWHYYSNTQGSIWNAPNSIEHICQQATGSGGGLNCEGSLYTEHVSMPPPQVLTDIANGELQQVSWVTPAPAYSDHALVNDGSGPAWVASIVNAIGNSAYWANTAIFITWDDWGGFYDHVAPTVINDGVSWGSGYVYGFRVPLIVISPYAKAEYISHTTHDFGSILSFVETNFNLPSLGYADSYADNMSDCFNADQTPITFQTIAASPKAEFFIRAPLQPGNPDDD